MANIYVQGTILSKLTGVNLQTTKENYLLKELKKYL
jgi:hypothetical protein